MQSVLIYGSETWSVKVADLNRLERTERMLIRWKGEVSLWDRQWICIRVWVLKVWQKWLGAVD